MGEVVDQVVVQNDVSESEEASASTSSGSSITSPTVLRSNVNKRKRSETPDFLERYRESMEEQCRKEKEEHRELDILCSASVTLLIILSSLPDISEIGSRIAYLTALKLEREVLNETEDQFENLHDFVSGEKSFCSLQFEKTSKQKRAQTTNLEVHQKIHTTENPFTCKQCGKSFTLKGSLKTHMRIHTGEKPYTCKQCGKSFAQSGNLEVHQKIHTMESPFICQQCGKSFTQKGSLKIHMRVHTGERPHTCKQCGNCFSQKGSLDRHMKIHNKEKPNRSP
ncbi:uncharacterized protein [Garra rufa]|uniref:uncharacterized protein n=1 Tax=Garra rufa TaxID=137080 RepID=UPI003CCE793B